jgi:uncharacterized DUF497 family protein
MLIVRRLLWDLWNVDHIARHEVTVDEVDEICQQNPITSETYAGRLRLIGRTQGGKILTVILSPQSEEGVYYPVTARTASRKERQLYRDQRGGAA